jgi:hypothetical protein
MKRKLPDRSWRSSPHVMTAPCPVCGLGTRVTGPNGQGQIVPHAPTCAAVRLIARVVLLSAVRRADEEASPALLEALAKLSEVFNS